MADLSTTGFDLLNPTAYPWSTSLSNSASTGDSTSTGSSSSVSNSYSGLGSGTISQLTNMVMPELSDSLAGISNLPNTYTQNALGLYKNLMNTGLNDSLAATLQEMASRGIIGGDVLSDAMSGTAAEVIPTYSNMGYQAGMDAAEMAQNIPSILGSLMQLAQYDQSSGSSSSSSQSNSTNQSASSSMSYQEDQSVPQGQLYDFLSGLDLSFL